MHRINLVYVLHTSLCGVLLLGFVVKGWYVLDGDSVTDSNCYSVVFTNLR